MILLYGKAISLRLECSEPAKLYLSAKDGSVKPCLFGLSGQQYVSGAAGVTMCVAGCSLRQ